MMGGLVSKLEELKRQGGHIREFKKRKIAEIEKTMNEKLERINAEMANAAEELSVIYYVCMMFDVLELMSDRKRVDSSLEILARIL